MTTLKKFNTDYDKSPWEKVSVDELKTPRAGKICYGASYWAITDDGFALFYRGSAQCNTVKSIVESIRSDCKVEFIEMAFVSHNCRDYF